MKLHADTKGSGYVANEHVVALRLVTEPNNLDEFIEVQVAELRDGSLNIVVFGTVGNPARDKHNNPIIRVWPSKKP